MAREAKIYLRRQDDSRAGLGLVLEHLYLIIVTDPSNNVHNLNYPVSSIILLLNRSRACISFNGNDACASVVGTTFGPGHNPEEIDYTVGYNGIEWDLY